MTPFRGLLILLVVTSCAGGGGALLNPTVAQLDAGKTLAQSGDDAALGRKPVACQPGQAGCAQLHALRAGACRRTADFDCALAEYRAALVLSRRAPEPQADPQTLQLALLESAHARRDAARAAAADRANQDLRAEAVAAQGNPGTRTAGYVYAANATLFGALQSPPPGGCAAIARAADDLAQARSAGTAFAANGRALEQAIANASLARDCAP